MNEEDNSQKITLGVLVDEWFSENMPAHYYYTGQAHFPRVYSIGCRCAFTRALAVILDEELEARIFYEPAQEGKNPDWDTLRPEDPEFFKKLKDGISKCHERRCTLSEEAREPRTKTK